MLRSSLPISNLRPSWQAGMGVILYAHPKEGRNDLVSYQWIKRECCGNKILGVR